MPIGEDLVSRGDEPVVLVRNGSGLGRRHLGNLLPIDGGVALRGLCDEHFDTVFVVDEPYDIAGGEFGRVIRLTEVAVSRLGEVVVSVRRTCAEDD